MPVEVSSPKITSGFKMTTAHAMTVLRRIGTMYPSHMATAAHKSQKENSKLLNVRIIAV